MTSRILSAHGNVIAADFRPDPGISFKATGQILYADGHVIVGRYEFYLDGELTTRRHYLIDLETGATSGL